MQWLTLARKRVGVAHVAGRTDGALGSVVRTAPDAAFLAVVAS